MPIYSKNTLAVPIAAKVTHHYRMEKSSGQSSAAIITHSIAENRNTLIEYSQLGTFPSVSDCSMSLICNYVTA